MRRALRCRLRLGWPAAILIVALAAVSCGPVAAPTLTPAPTQSPTPAVTPALSPTDTLVPPTPTATPIPTPQRTSLVIWHDLPAAQAAQLKDEIGRVEAFSEPVLIDLQRYENEEALERSLSQGSIDLDLVLGNAQAVGFMQEKNLIQPVHGLFGDDLWRSLARPGVEGVILDGQTWAVPHTVGLQLMMYYNTTLVPTPPPDTAAMIALAREFKAPEHYAVGMNVLDPLWSIPWLSAYGGWPTDDAGRPTLNTEPMTRTLTFIHDLAHKYVAMQPMMDYDDGLAAFKAGQIAVWIDGDWVVSSLKEAKNLQWAVARLPVLAETGREPAGLIAGKYIAIHKDVTGPMLDAARLIVEQLVGVEAQKRWTQAFGVLPASIPVLTDPVIQGDPFLRVSASQVLAGKGVGLSSGIRPAMEAMRGPIEDVMARRIVPAEAARGMQERAEALASGR